jgi:heme-degrading monooxygenase HmoA
MGKNSFVSVILDLKDHSPWVFVAATTVLCFGVFRIYRWNLFPKSETLGSMKKSLVSYNPLKCRMSRAEYKSIYVAPWEFSTAWRTADLDSQRSQTIYLSHTSFTLSSYLEIIPFTSKAAAIFEQVSQASGYIGHSSAFSPWTKTLDTLTAWESWEAMKAFAKSDKHRQVLNNFYSGKQFSRTPRWHVERFECEWKLLEPCVQEYGNYGKSLQLWETILTMDQHSLDSPHVVRIST